MEDTDKDSILKYKRGSRRREFEDLQIDTTTREENGMRVKNTSRAWETPVLTASACSMDRAEQRAGGRLRRT